MSRRMNARVWLIGILLFNGLNAAQALQITDQFSLDWLSSGAWQCEQDNAGLGYNWLCRGGAVFQPSFTYSPTDKDTFTSLIGFAAGNALNNVTPFNLQPWNGDLESTVRHINGRNRSFILTANYAHEFQINGNYRLVSTTGIIDSSIYFITNVFANDEYTQFMSGPLTFGQNVIVPSYDYGTVLQWFAEKHTITAVYMNIGKLTNSTVHYNYLGIQLMFNVENSWGKGHYRFMVDVTDRKFFAANNTRKPDNLVMASFDQELGPIYGAWVRFGTQTRDLLETFADFYSGGINIKGKLWGRENDNIGIGAVHAGGGASPFSNSFLAEAYYRYQVNNHLAITPDIQYQINRFDDVNTLRGVFLSLRATVTA